MSLAVEISWTAVMINRVRCAGGSGLIVRAADEQGAVALVGSLHDNYNQEMPQCFVR